MKLLLALAASAALLQAGDINGSVLDPSGHAVAGAKVAVINSTGVIASQITDDRGRFTIYISPLYEKPSLLVTAPGFETATAPLTASAIGLTLAPVSESIGVVASALGVLSGRQGSSVSVVGGAELRGRNEAQLAGVLRELPGMVFAQNGSTGANTTLFVRGGDSKYNLVLLNGIPLNSFVFGGLFDFAHLPVDAIEEIEVARGPQSAIYGSYALASVVSLTTRSPEDGTALDLTAEGGSHAENRFAASGSGMASRDFGLAGSLSSLMQNGPVPNSDYRNQGGLLDATFRHATQNVFAFGSFDSNDAGQPGAFGYGPVDTVSRTRDNTSTYGAHWQDALSENWRADVLGGFNLNNSYFVSPDGGSFNKDIRAFGEIRSTYAFTSFWSAAVGYSFAREELRNSFVSGLLRRDDHGAYLESRVVQGNLTLNAGVREEIYPGIKRLAPKVSAGYSVGATRRLHGSYGTGIRPPGGLELTFTNNPSLKPERIQSYDIGFEQRLFGDRLSLETAWFHNRYRDLIVSLGGNLATLSSYRTDNLSNARAQGIETSATFRPTAWATVSANYTWLETEVLGIVPNYFYAGQPLIRRPKHSGGFLATLRYGKADANLTGSIRGRTLDVEPNFGAAAGLFRNAGYQQFGINVNYRVRGNLTLYGNLRNALNRRYEETFGYPAPLLNVAAGVRWQLNRAR